MSLEARFLQREGAEVCMWPGYILPPLSRGNLTDTKVASNTRTAVRHSKNTKKNTDDSFGLSSCYRRR